MGRCLPTKHELSLGLERIRGRCGAVEVLARINTVLDKFDISIDHDIFSITTDAASVMTKLGKDCPEVPFHLLCHAHGLHLAVGDLLYEKKGECDLSLVSSIEVR